MIKLHIFDADGTILDSMRMWDEITITYLRSIGIEPDSNLPEIIDPMTLPEAMRYIADLYNIEGGAQTVDEGMKKLLIHEYHDNIVPFDGMLDELEAVHSEGIPMIIFSNTPHIYLDAALERTGVMKFFEKVYTVEDIGIRKDLPDAFAAVCSLYDIKPEEAIVYEDSPFALEAARNAGCHTKEYDRYR